VLPFSVVCFPEPAKRLCCTLQRLLAFQNFLCARGGEGLRATPFRCFTKYPAGSFRRADDYNAGVVRLTGAIYVPIVSAPVGGMAIYTISAAAMVDTMGLITLSETDMTTSGQK
jgi:hypothetical protein